MRKNPRGCVTWKAPTGKNRWGQEINGSPGEKWYYLFVAVICFLLSGFSYAGYFLLKQFNNSV
jgi:hypothetical protein